MQTKFTSSGHDQKANCPVNARVGRQRHISVFSENRFYLASRFSQKENLVKTAPAWEGRPQLPRSTRDLLGSLGLTVVSESMLLNPRKFVCQGPMRAEGMSRDGYGNELQQMTTETHCWWHWGSKLLAKCPWGMYGNLRTGQQGIRGFRCLTELEDCLMEEGEEEYYSRVWKELLVTGHGSRLW